MPESYGPPRRPRPAPTGSHPPRVRGPPRRRHSSADVTVRARDARPRYAAGSALTARCVTERPRGNVPHVMGHRVSSFGTCSCDRRHVSARSWGARRVAWRCSDAAGQRRGEGGRRPGGAIPGLRRRFGAATELGDLGRRRRGSGLLRLRPAARFQSRRRDPSSRGTCCRCPGWHAPMTPPSRPRPTVAPRAVAAAARRVRGRERRHRRRPERPRAGRPERPHLPPRVLLQAVRRPGAGARAPPARRRRPLEGRVHPRRVPRRHRGRPRRGRRRHHPSRPHHCSCTQQPTLGVAARAASVGHTARAAVGRPLRVGAGARAGGRPHGVRRGRGSHRGDERRVLSGGAVTGRARWVTRAAGPPRGRTGWPSSSSCSRWPWRSVCTATSRVS